MRRTIVGSFSECPHCHAEDVSVYAENAGIGPYEFWGAKCFDRRMVYLCDECEEEIEEFDPDRDGYGPPERDDYEEREERRLWRKER